jgi:hypothetical protein
MAKIFQTQSARYTSDDNGERLFHSIERTMKSDTTRDILTKQNQDALYEILKDIDTWLSSKFIDAQSCISFRAHQSVKVFTSKMNLMNPLIQLPSGFPSAALTSRAQQQLQLTLRPQLNLRVTMLSLSS